MTKEQLYTECFAFTNDFASAGSLTGRAMVAFVDRAQDIINRFKVAKAMQAKGKKK
jgi:hypothetical protein